MAPTITATPTSGTAPLTVSFSGSGSTDSDGSIVGWNWNFGDGTTGSGATVSHVYSSAGSYIAVLQVTDSGGLTAVKSTMITVGAPPVVKVQGGFKALSRTPLDAQDTRALAYSVLSEAQVQSFEMTLECDISLNLPEIGRFRLNVFWQRGAVALVARYIRFEIPELAALGLEAEILLFKLGVAKARVKATVEGETACEGEIRFALVDISKK